jgi:perosamine synthetase
LEVKVIPIQRPSLGVEELEEVKKVFDSGWLGLGNVVYEFEDMVKRYLDAEDIVAVNSGTSALHIALDSLGIGSGDEVIVPSLTFCASVQVITSLGAIPVFCEIDPLTLNINVDDAKKRITSRTKAVMPVHYCGNPCDMDSLLSFGKENNIFIVEDAAHAFGSLYKGKKIGGFGNVTCFSFDPIKTLTCGEGGAVSVNHDLSEMVRRKRNLGIDKDAYRRYEGTQNWFYEVATQGYRYHMSNINAAIGMAQLKKLPFFIKRKQSIVKAYNEQFSKIRGISLLNWNVDEVAPFSYIIRVLDNRRDLLIEFLKTRGVGSGVHYIPNHMQPFFAKYASWLPVTEAVWREIITLPLYVDMKENDVQKVIDSVNDFFVSEC